MRMPRVNDEIFVKSYGSKGRITGIEDDIVRVKFDNRRGPPYRVHISELHAKNAGISGKFRIGFNIGIVSVSWETS
jgi:hypothetical protein